MTEPQHAPGWHPAHERPDQERYYDGTTWTSAFRPAETKAVSRGRRGVGTAKLTPVGKFIQLLALAAVVAGLYVGFGMHARSVGVDGTSLSDLANAHEVDCGTAFNVTYTSVVCEQALAGRKTTAIVLLVVGTAAGLGASAFRERP